MYRRLFVCVCVWYMYRMMVLCNLHTTSRVLFVHSEKKFFFFFNWFFLEFFTSRSLCCVISLAYKIYIVPNRKVLCVICECAKKRRLNEILISILFKTFSIKRKQHKLSNQTFSYIYLDVENSSERKIAARQ